MEHEEYDFVYSQNEKQDHYVYDDEKYVVYQFYLIKKWIDFFDKKN